MPTILWLSVITSVRTVIVSMLECSEFVWLLENEGVSKRLEVACLRVGVSVAAISLRLVVSLAQTFLEECGDVVGDTQKLLIAICLCSLETTGYVPPDEGHRDGVGAGAMVGACDTLLCL